MTRTDGPAAGEVDPAATARPTRHLHLVRPPSTEPPTSSPAAHVDDEAVGRVRSAAGRRARPVQAALPLLFVLPGGAPSRPTAPRALRVVPAPLDPDEESAGGEPTPRSQLPDPRRWAGALVQAAVETRFGDRPVSQLVRWTTRQVYEQLVRDAGTSRAPVGRRERVVRPVIRSLHLSEPDDGVVEACSVVHDGRRGRAVAVRIEGVDGRWVCTALDVL